MEIFKKFTFEASHSLPLLPEGHPCRKLHGHSFRVEIRARGPVPDESGWVMDFAELDAAVRPVLGQLDHAHLNEVEGLGNPTSERIALWLWRRLKPALPGLSRVEVMETETTGCVYTGEDERP
jgi:6-pyruvoyltetrahydropterin/6-carboxytetrahydropterin synthase